MAQGRKKKLLVILGAGSSMPCGMPSVTDIDHLMKEWSPAWTNPPEFPEGSIGNGVFLDLWNIIEEYYRRDPQPHRGIHLNYEKVLGEMIALASWVTPSPFGNTLHQAVSDARPSSAFTWPPGRVEPFFYRLFTIDQLGFLLGKLAVHMRGHCKSLNTTTPSFASYRYILEQLQEAFDVGIYNLNYDNVAVSALPDAFTGFSGGKFAAREVSSREDWNFIYHLHGSVHYSLTGTLSRPSILWKDDLSDEFEDSRPLSPNMAGEFRPIIPTTLVAGGFKLDQLLADPAQTFFASLVRHVHQADAFLIAGYGFGDVHVNRALQNRFSASHDDPRGRPPTIVATKTNSPFGLIGDRQGYEFLPWELTHTLNTRFTSDQAVPAPRFSVPELIERGIFETDPFQRTAIWHGGFLEAQARMDRFIRWLRQ